AQPRVGGEHRRDEPLALRPWARLGLRLRRCDVGARRPRGALRAGPPRRLLGPPLGPHWGDAGRRVRRGIHGARHDGGGCGVDRGRSAAGARDLARHAASQTARGARARGLAVGRKAALRWYTASPADASVRRFLRDMRAGTKTWNAKPGEVERRWFVVDAEGKTLGRLAVVIADTLRGKDKPEYTPHVDTGDFVVVVNAQN